MIVHELKTWPSYFRPIWDGEKTFEIRFDDRGFQRGDVVNLREWDRGLPCECHSTHHAPGTCSRYTGRRVLAEIGYVTASTSPRGQQRGFEGRGYVVFSLINVEHITEDLAALALVEAQRGESVDAMTWSAPSPADIAARVPSQRDP